MVAAASPGVHCNGTSPLLDSGGDRASNSGEGEANVEEGVARNDQW